MATYCLIYDFETAGTKYNAVALSIGAMVFDLDRLSEKPYLWDELNGMSCHLKFDVKEQVSIYRRSMDKNTLDWWAGQGEEAKKILKSSSEDVSIRELPSFMTKVIEGKNLKKVFTRGNNFDPIILETLYSDVGGTIPYFWSKIRDTRSYIEGLSYGSVLKNNFIPSDLTGKKLSIHDAATDICLDVYRIQTLIQALNVT